MNEKIQNVNTNLVFNKSCQENITPIYVPAYLYVSYIYMAGGERVIEQGGREGEIKTEEKRILPLLYRNIFRGLYSVCWIWAFTVGQRRYYFYKSRIILKEYRIKRLKRIRTRQIKGFPAVIISIAPEF